ncbi:hypothetical protein STIAU_5749, partial [Stigmatella aurantiaca DW4/3-1]
MVPQAAWAQSPFTAEQMRKA